MFLHSLTVLKALSGSYSLIHFQSHKIWLSVCCFSLDYIKKHSSHASNINYSLVGVLSSNLKQMLSWRWYPVMHALLIFSSIRKNIINGFTDNDSTLCVCVCVCVCV
uniref:Uncharacterized protein n=1 Tax=Octopus bimaculoides TaxID=37653 RepID=A0A0L8FLC6_OCTBM